MFTPFCKLFKVSMFIALLLALSGRGHRRRRHSKNSDAWLQSDPLQDLKALSPDDRLKVIQQLRRRAQKIASEESKKYMTQLRKKSLKNMLKLGMMRDAGLPAHALVKGDAESMLPLLLMFNENKQEFSNSGSRKSYEEVMKEAEQVLQMFD